MTFVAANVSVITEFFLTFLVFNNRTVLPYISLDVTCTPLRLTPSKRNRKLKTLLRGAKLWVDCQRLRNDAIQERLSHDAEDFSGWLLSHGI